MPASASTGTARARSSSTFRGAGAWTSAAWTTPQAETIRARSSVGPARRRPRFRVPRPGRCRRTEPQL